MYDPLFKLDQTGVLIHYYSNRRKYTPVHWHSAVELIYVLNGTSMIRIGDRRYTAVAGEFVVIDANQLHEYKYEKTSMILSIHFSRRLMKNFVPDLGNYRFSCTKDRLKPEQLEPYLDVCKLLMELPPLYIRQPIGHELKSQAVAMEIFFELLNHFTEKGDIQESRDKREAMERMNEILNYIDQHYAEPLPLESIASQFYLSREYFSRFFRKHMGMPYSKYVNQVRIMHVYQDVCNASAGILELAEKHGFTNYKLFNQLFRETYGCTPREIRQAQTGRKEHRFA